MNNSATTIAIIPSQAEDKNKVSVKSVYQNLTDKITVYLSDVMSEIIIAFVVALFTLLIKIKGLESLSGFCFPNKLKKSI